MATIRRTALLLLALTLSGAIPVQAQICAGNPATPGRPAAGIGVGWNEALVAYAIDLFANPRGPLALSAGYRWSQGRVLEADGHAFNGDIRYEARVSRVSICPSTGLGYSRAETRVPPNGTRSNAVSGSIALVAGVLLHDGDRLRFAPFGGPSYGVSRVTLDSGGSDTFDSFGATAGALFILADRVSGAGAIRVDDDGDISYRVQLGLLLR